MNTHDWFAGMQQPTQSESDNIYEVRFKNTRKAFFKNVNALPLITGDFVVVESDRGYDVGQVSLGGILARLQMRKRKVRADDRVRKIYRRATREDVEKLQTARSREQETLVRTREVIRELDLDMKLSDVEYQGDNTKAIFYYIADTRVDFRELIKRLANDFRIRVEMKQIGLRHESGLVGGIGSCGRELCCATWLTDFKTVSTAAARYQNLSLNPMKISGQCGRLKCCLNFELDSYMDALKDIPKIERIETETGMAFLQKTDIFKKIMWFSYQGESTWISISTDKVRQLHEMNQAGVKPASLQILDAVLSDLDKPVDFVDVVGQSVLREDPKRKKKKKKKRPEGAGPETSAQGRGPRTGDRQEQRPPRNPEDRQGPPRNREQNAGTGPKERRDGRPQRKPEDRQDRGPRNPDQQAGGSEEQRQARNNNRNNRGRGGAPKPGENPQNSRPPRPEGGNNNRREGRPPRGPKPSGENPTPPAE